MKPRSSPRSSTRSLSPREAAIVLPLEAEGREELTLDEIQERSRISRAYARRLAHDLVAKGWIQATRPGRYLLNPARRGPDALPDTDPFRVGSHLAAPYYFGYATAAELHGLLPQASRVYYVVTTARSGTRRRGPLEYRLVHAPRTRFFGTEVVRRREGELRVSDRERTLVDCLDRPELAGGVGGVAQIVASAKPRLDAPRLLRHVRRFGNRSLAHRLGYLLETLRPSMPAPGPLLAALRPLRGAPYAPLGAPAVYGRRGRWNDRWHLIENVPEGQLFAEVDLR